MRLHAVAFAALLNRGAESILQLPLGTALEVA